MITQTDLIGYNGPVVRVEFTLPGPDILRLRTAGQPVPQPVYVNALIDTGADVTVVDTGVLTPFISAGMQPTRFLYTNAPAVGGLSPTPEYRVGFFMGRSLTRRRQGLSLPVHVVYERALGATGYQALLGRDVLASCGFFYDGPGRRFTLAY